MRSTTKTRTARRLLAGLTAGFALLAVTEHAEAQEILLTGPLAGAPAVRKLRLYREGRFEAAPVFSFTLLDEYKRQIIPGLKLNYNITDWLAIGVWAGIGVIDPLNLDTDLSKKIQGVNRRRRQAEAARLQADPNAPRDRNILLTRENLGPNFTDQTGTIAWIAVPQITLIPFRGKLALFQALYVDADLHLFAGPAIVGVDERGDCDIGQCIQPESFNTEQRLTVTGSFGMGFTFFVNKWNSFGFDYRLTPFKRNTGGFDIAGLAADGTGGGPFPDRRLTAADRELKINQMISVQWSFFFPQQYRISE